MSSKPKIFVLCAYAPSVISFRGKLLTSLIKKQHDIILSAPNIEACPALISWCSKEGISYFSTSLINTKVGVFGELKELSLLYNQIRKEHPDILLLYGIKPVIYGSICGFLNRTKKIFSTITGLGHFFMEENIHKPTSKLLAFLYKLALKANNKVLFQNKDDATLFIERKLVSPRKVDVVNGSGVDTHFFTYVGPTLTPIRFTFVGRMIKQKGILEFYAAAKKVKAQFPEVVFSIIGGLYANPSVLSVEEFNEIIHDKDIEYNGEVKDVRKYLKKTSVFVLPSYREGTSRAILEAMSIGLPIVTTDVPGCRQLVQEGRNGFLVKPRDEKDLENTMIHMIKNKKKWVSMGTHSRKIVEDKYSIKKVNESILHYIGVK